LFACQITRDCKIGRKLQGNAAKSRNAQGSCIEECNPRNIVAGSCVRFNGDIGHETIGIHLFILLSKSKNQMSKIRLILIIFLLSGVLGEAKVIAGTNMKTMTQVGSMDRNIPYTQSRNFYDALKSVLGSDKVSFELLEGAGHGGPQFSAPSNIEKVIAFFDKYLK
jgi:hypothetical protein